MGKTFCERLSLEPLDPVYSALFIYTKSLSVALDYRDSLTQLHSGRVSGLAGEIGVCCGLSIEEVGILKIAAAFHDIGKIGIPDHVLLKPAQFDEAEWDKMKQHPEIGEKIMVATALEGAQLAALAIRHHHEHYNGEGYPDHLCGDEIPLASRIISIADSYDAMAQTRSYHRSKTHSEIMPILHKETGEKHDPKVMRIFCDIIDTLEFKTDRI